MKNSPRKLEGPHRHRLVLALGLLLGLALSAHAQSSRPGLGSIPYGSGVTFRVWAPNATSVQVSNATTRIKTALVSEANGYWSVDVANAVTGQQYCYYMNSTIRRRDPRSRLVSSSGSTGNSIIYDTTAFNWGSYTNYPATNLALNDLVIYEMHVGTFYSPSGTTPAKFTNVAQKLPFFNDMGINAVELMPISEFSGDRSWGYNPADPFAVENSGYGGPNGLKSLVKASHSSNVAVFVDTVHNHYDTGGDARYSLWQFDGWSSGGYGGIYFYNEALKCCTPWGARPDFSRQEVCTFIHDQTRMLLEECKVDGFRWDSVENIRKYNSETTDLPEGHAFLQAVNSMIHTSFPGRVSIAEGNSITDGFDSYWEYWFHNDVKAELIKANDSDRQMQQIVNCINTDKGFARVIFLENHDSCANGSHRFIVQVDSADPTSWRARKMSILGSAIVLTSVGMPMLFQGQEMMMTNDFSDATILNWTRTNTYAGVTRAYRAMIHARRNLEGRTAGLKGNQTAFYQNDNNNKVLAYHRYPASSHGSYTDVYVAVNFANTRWTNNNYSLQFPYTGTWTTVFNSDSTEFGSDFENIGPASINASGNPPTAPVNMGAYSVLIFHRGAWSGPPPQTLQFASATYSVSETGGTVRVYVSRALGSTGAVSVAYATTNGTATAGSDYTATNGTLNWANGDAADKYFNVTISDDLVYEGNETFTARLSGATGAILGSPASTAVTITDNETPPGTLQFASATYSVAETGGAVRIYVSRTGGSGGAVSVSYATANGTATAGSDYTAASGTLNWTNGDAANKYFDVSIMDDSDYEGNETFTAALGGATGATLGSPTSTVVTITDNETPPGTLQLASATYSVAETGGAVRIYVTRTGGAGGAANVNYATANGTATAGSDYTATNGTLNWPNNDATNKYFDVSITDDSAYEGNETLVANLSGASGASMGTPTSTTVTITEPPLPELAITNPATDIAVGNGTSNYTVQGMAIASNWAGLAWTNSLTGGAGVLAIVNSWSISGVPLAVGTNVITVTATNVPVAGVSAVDSATNSAYSGGWSNGFNGGTGWGGGWALTASGANAGFFRAQSSVNTNCQIGTYAWGLWASSANRATAVRPFASMLAMGQVFRCQFDNNVVDTNYYVGIGFQNAAGSNLFRFLYSGGRTTYTIVDTNSAGIDTGIANNVGGWNLSFELTSATTYVFKCGRVGGTNTITGTLGGPADRAIVAFNAYNYSSGAGETRNFYINNISLTGAATPGASTSDTVRITRAVGSTDSDGDGMNDTWETAHGLTVGTNDSNEDLDGDGIMNLREYIEDSNPQVSNTPLRVGLAGMMDQQVYNLSGDSRSTNSRMYDLLWSTGLPGGVWTVIPPAVSGHGDGTPVVWTVTNEAGAIIYYRARVKLP